MTAMGAVGFDEVVIIKCGSGIRHRHPGRYVMGGHFVSAIHPRKDEGAVSLYVVGQDGQVSSNFWPASSGMTWSEWYEVGTNPAGFPEGCQISVVHPRSDEGAVSLYGVANDGKVWSAFWPAPDGSGKWSGWFPLGDNVFTPGSPVGVIHPRSDEGAVSLYVVGLDGKVWTNFWPAGSPANWNGWYSLDNPVLFPQSATVSVVHPRSDEGAVSLYAVANDGKVWSAFWPAPDGSGKWSGWFPLGDNVFTPGSPVGVIHPRSDEGAVSLYVVGLDGKVWTNFWPAGSPANWNGWYSLDNPVLFPQSATVSVVHPRSDEGAVSLYAVANDGKVWSAFWPAPDGSGKWSGWFPLGDNVFTPGSPVAAIHPRSDEGAVSLYVVGLDDQVWTNFWPAGTPANWNGWFAVPHTKVWGDPQHPIQVTFDDSTALGGTISVVMNDNGDWTFTGHLHDSGFDSYDFTLAVVIMTPSGIAYALSHQGHTEGTSANPFGPNRDCDWTTSGNNPSIRDNWSQVIQGRLQWRIVAQDLLAQEVSDLVQKVIHDLVSAAAAAGVSAVVALL
ncbi:hypothetical protein [Nocardia sp. NPDC004722]